MGMYRDQLLPRALDLSMRRAAFAEQRAQVAAGLDGEVLEIGFGTGLNIPFYPAAVKRVLAVEPAGGGRAVAARRLAAQARAGRPVPVEFAGRKDSGLGQVHGRNAIRGYTHALPILIDRWGRKKETSGSPTPIRPSGPLNPASRPSSATASPAASCAKRIRLW